MKVLHVVVENNIGGIQNRILRIAGHLKDRGVESVILAPSTPGTFSNAAKDQGIPVFLAAIQSPNLNNSLSNMVRNMFWLLTFPVGVFQTIRIIRQEKIQIIHANGLLSLHAVAAGILLNRQVCWDLISTLYPPFLVTLLRPLFSHPAVLPVLITRFTNEYYFGSKKDTLKYRIIYEPVDVQHFQRSAELTEQGREFLKSFPVGESAKIITFIGNINPQKGLEYFIRTVPEIQKGYHGTVKFFIVGKPVRGNEYYLAKIQKLTAEMKLENDIFFTGPIDDLRPILSGTDIFFMTSIAEGTPLVILEAMAMEVPVISTGVGGIPDQVADGVTGIVIPPENRALAADPVLHLLGHPEIGAAMGKEGRKRVQEHFSLERCVDEHYKLYTGLLPDAR